MNNTLVVATAIFASAIIIKGVLEYVSAKEQAKATREVLEKVLDTHGSHIADRIADSLVEKVDIDSITRGE